MPTDTLNRYPEERRIATVLFADVQGFTALAEQLDFETVSDLIKGLSIRMDQAIELHNGYIDKHLGDGVMAVWGAPFASDKDAEEAVAAGLDLIKAIAEFCKKTKIPGAENLKLRVGINSGQVFAGYVGLRRDYTVIGDTVNLASRLEKLADPGAVVISESTLRMVRGSFRVRALEPAHVKGKSELVQPYAVEGRQANPGRIRYQSADSLVTNMVGRDEDLQKLLFIYDHAFQTDIPHMALITGDVGIGKSRLLMEFSNYLEDSGDNIHILSTRGLAQTSKIPFYLWRTLLRNRYGVKDDDPGNTSPEKLTAAETDSENDPQDAKVQATQVIGEMIGLAGKSAISNERLQRMFFLTRELLRQLSARKKLVLLLDDLQWADRESLQMLSYLLKTEQQPFQIMLVGAARTEFVNTQTQWHNLTRVMALNPLGLTAELVGKAYPEISQLPDTILQEIAYRAEGNPYFLEEIVKNLLKAHPPENENASGEFYERALAQIPESLRATLQARLDSLSREARTVALLASVVGRVFWVGAVMAEARSTTLPGTSPMVNVPELVVNRFIQDGLRQLVRAELAFPRSGSRFSQEQEYIFKNSYLRDVAYSLIPNRSRAQYHKAVAEWLKSKTDPAYQGMAREHEQSAKNSANIATGTLNPPTEINHE